MQILSPSRGQLAWQKSEFGVFCHFGINTFHGQEWSDGSLPAMSFNPIDLDARQWVRTAKEAGAQYFILTAKHHDGFCRWPTATTDYSVAAAPWRDGQGDVVREVADACAAAGMALGLYLSPWDRNSPVYSDPAAYDDFYIQQFTELCTNYGPLVELWFDGAGSQGREYDWKRIMAVAAEHQPEAMVFNMGAPTIRWVGNEDGLAHDPVEYVVDRTDFDNYTVQTTSFDEALYLPPECDVSIRRGWFWAPADQPKSLDHLLAIYYNSIGMGANLLLNLPPNSLGLIPDEDRARLTEWRTELDRRFAAPITASLTRHDDHWLAEFDHEVTFDQLELGEDYSTGQRVRGHRAQVGDLIIAEGQTIGHKRLHAFEPVTTRAFKIMIDGESPELASVRVFDTGAAGIPAITYRAPTEIPE